MPGPRELQRFERGVRRRGGPDARQRARYRPLGSEAILAWQQTQQDASPPPLAVLRSRRIGVEAPLLEGTDDWTLNQGVGHIEGHRGARRRGQRRHRRASGRILPRAEGRQRGRSARDRDPRGRRALSNRAHVDRGAGRRVRVLDLTAVPSVTLVTCYPFYFVGSAPQRFIVARSARAHCRPTRRAIETDLRQSRRQKS